MTGDAQEGYEDSPETLQRSELIRTVTRGTFDSLVLQGDGPIAVEFMSYGCGHCRALEPALQQVANILKGKEKIFKVNLAAEQGLAASFEVEGTPTFVMFLNGREAGRSDGPHPTVPSVLTAITHPFQ